MLREKRVELSSKRMSGLSETRIYKNFAHLWETVLQSSCGLREHIIKVEKLLSSHSESQLSKFQKEVDLLREEVS